MTATEMMAFAAAEAAVDALALVIALRLLGHAVRPVRVAAGAAEGALLACLCAWAAPGRAVQLAYWLPAAMLMMLTADALAWRHPLRSAAVLLAACGLLGGVVQALCGATGSPAAAWMTGGRFPLPPPHTSGGGGGERAGRA